MFHTSKFSYLFFQTPPLKQKRGLQIGGRLLIAKHLDQSLWFRYDWAIRNTEQQSDHIYFTLWACVCQALLCPLPASANCALLLGWNHFAEPNRHVYFSSSNFNLQVTCWVWNGVVLTIWMFSFCSALKIHYIYSFIPFSFGMKKNWHENSSTGPLFYFTYTWIRLVLLQWVFNKYLESYAINAQNHSCLNISLTEICSLCQ